MSLEAAGVGAAAEAAAGGEAEAEAGAAMFALCGVGAAYGSSAVVHDIALSVGAGEAVALLGRNGVGKTTLLRVAMGLHAAARGQILFDGRDITRAGAHRRARLGIGYVPQGRGIFPHLTVEENLRTGLEALAGREGAAETSLPEHIFELFPALDRLRKRAGGVLSGGEQQQVAIARALAGRPRLLLLDEPTEGIQPSIVQQIEEALKKINTQLKVAILLVEQYLDFAWSIADKFYMMRRGRIVERGATAGRAAESVAALLGV